jgi:hypothetical protein
MFHFRQFDRREDEKKNDYVHLTYDNVTHVEACRFERMKIGCD